MSEERIITFEPAAWGHVRERLRAHSRVLPGAAALAGPSYFDAIGTADLAAGTRVIPELGWGVVRAPNIDLAGLAAVPGIRIRRPRRFRRPATVLTPTPPTQSLPLAPGVPHGALWAGLLPMAGPGPGGMWFDNAALTWVLQSIGVSATDREGEGITVGVIDTGIDRTHPDIAAAIDDALPSPEAPAWRGDEDLIGHGTHVAGVIAGAAAPVQGPRYGIAPRARIVSYRIYEAHEETTEPIVVTAIHAALKRGCRVIALASGVSAGDTFSTDDAHLGELVEASGAVLFAAGGNESRRKLGVIAPTNAPANAPRIEAVGATDTDDTLWDASNGTATDLARRIDWLGGGVDVVSALRDTQNKTGKTICASGTSAATAVVAGIAAAVWSRNTGWSAEQLRAVLRGFTQSVTGPPGAVGNGRLRVR